MPIYKVKLSVSGQALWGVPILRQRQKTDLGQLMVKHPVRSIPVG
ncbi:hypothetical protein [Nostoc sp.]